MNGNELIQLGTIGFLFAIAIREFFGWLKTRKQNGNNYNYNGQILKELQTMNANHLHSLQEAIEEGNSRLINAIHSDNTKIIELLGEIKGRLSAIQK